MLKLIIWTMAALIVITGIVAYSQWQWGGRGSGSETWSIRGGIAQLGRQPIVRHGCGACHVIGGIGRANGRVGPKLQGIHEQIYLAGVIPNTAENMVLWIMHPERVAPGTAMPDLDVLEQDARHIAAYLYKN